MNENVTIIVEVVAPQTCFVLKSPRMMNGVGN
jgi:hypothetical protein